MPDEECIDYETDVTVGELAVNDAYDLYLIAKGKKPRNFTLVCFINLQFFFEDSGTLIWTDIEKKDFIRKWENAVKTSWGNRILKYLKDGRKITLIFRFKIQIGGFWSSDHWELSVRKTPDNWAPSYVKVDLGNVQLDDKDLNRVHKQFGYQKDAIHEFGHMLGLDDEYIKGSIWIKDKNSVMNNGGDIKGRHLTFFAIWLNKKLSKHRIQ